MQNAIWEFINGGGFYGPNPVTNHIIDQANANGEGFVPQTGQDACVLLWPIWADGSYRANQITFVIVDP
jgi:hypothetical protein